MLAPGGPTTTDPIRDASPQTSPQTLSFTEEPWHVVRTSARCEKIVAGQLRSSGIHCFLPLTRVRRVYGGEPCTVEVATFPQCVFARGNRQALLRAASAHVREVRPASGGELEAIEEAFDRTAAVVVAEA
jgi:hypothetical protein